MARVIILKDLKNQILKKFKGESKKVFNLIYSLKENPRKGKLLASVENIIIKELKYEGFRFYFITNGKKINVMSGSKLADLLVKFVRMSDKKSQQKTIEEIKNILRKFGEEGF